MRDIVQDFPKGSGGSVLYSSELQIKEGYKQ